MNDLQQSLTVDVLEEVDSFNTRPQYGDTAILSPVSITSPAGTRNVESLLVDIHEEMWEGS